MVVEFSRSLRVWGFNGGTAYSELTSTLKMYVVTTTDHKNTKSGMELIAKITACIISIFEIYWGNSTIFPPFFP